MLKKENMIKLVSY